jgi:hypothetical protein
MSSIGPHNNQIQKAGAVAAHQADAFLPTSDLERSRDYPIRLKYSRHEYGEYLHYGWML